MGAVSNIELRPLLDPSNKEPEYLVMTLVISELAALYPLTIRLSLFPFPFWLGSWCALVETDESGSEM